MFTQAPILKPVMKAALSTKVSTVQKFVFKRLDESTQKSFSSEEGNEDVSTNNGSGNQQVRFGHCQIILKSYHCTSYHIFRIFRCTKVRLYSL